MPQLAILITNVVYNQEYIAHINFEDNWNAILVFVLFTTTLNYFSYLVMFISYKKLTAEQILLFSLNMLK